MAATAELDAAVRRLMDRTLPVLDAAFDVEADHSEPRDILIGLGEKLATLAAGPHGLGIYRLTVAEAPCFRELAWLSMEGSGRVVVLLTRLFDPWHATKRLPLSGTLQSAAQVFMDLVAATPRNKAVIGMPLLPHALRLHVSAAVDVFLRGCGEGSRL